MVRGAGFFFVLVVGIVATAVGVVAGFLSEVFSSFDAVGGQGGLMGSVFAGRVEFRVNDRPEDALVPVGIAAFVAIVIIVKYAKEALATGRESSTSFSIPIADASSSGVLLNGKPLGEAEPKKRFWQ
ncbi:hypothetical protein FB472_1992 [Rhodoglobus vestalii]|uniref:Uncharacterized protein n=1 Tax=Rhodoglobus vestalii TaxID=193384 RepID=A0A8H2PUD0_9MICO|nr:hypothetical protein FB472_1992 [Rhodoglobus vestalii]